MPVATKLKMAKMARNDRLCQLCNLADIEDEYHYTMCCKLLNQKRQKSTCLAYFDNLDHKYKFDIFKTMVYL